MKSKLPSSWLVACIIIAGTGYAVSQTATNMFATNGMPPLPLVPVTVTDKIIAFRKLLSPWEFMLVPLATAIIQILKMWIPKIPVTLWPWAAPVLGAGLDYLAIQTGLWTGNPIVGAVFGSMGTWLYTVAKPTGWLPSSTELAKPPAIGNSNPG